MPLYHFTQVTEVQHFAVEASNREEALELLLSEGDADYHTETCHEANDYEFDQQALEEAQQ